MTEIIIPKKDIPNKNFLFTSAAFARITKEKIVAVADKTDLLRYSFGATFKINAEALGTLRNSTSYVSFANRDGFAKYRNPTPSGIPEWTRQWRDDKADVSQKTIYPIFSDVALPLIEARSNVENHLRKKGYLYVNAGPDLPPGTAMAPVEDNTYVDQYPEQLEMVQVNKVAPTALYSKAYLAAIFAGAQATKESKSIARFSMACDVLGTPYMPLDKGGTTFVTKDDIPQWHAGDSLYQVSVSFPKAVFIDQITATPDEFVNGHLLKIPLAKNILPGAVVQPVPSSLELPAYDGLAKNTWHSSLAAAAALVAGINNKNPFPYPSRDDLNCIFLDESKVGLTAELKNKTVLMEKVSEYNKAPHALAIRNFYKDSLWPDKNTPLQGPKSILYKGGTYDKLRTIVLEVDDLLNAGSGKDQAYIDISFTANFKADNTVNKITAFASNAANTTINKRIFLRRYLQKKLEFPDQTYKFFNGPMLEEEVIYKRNQGDVSYTKIDVLKPINKDFFPNNKTFSYSNAAYTALNAVKDPQKISNASLLKAGDPLRRKTAGIFNGQLAPYEVIGYKISKFSDDILLSEIIILGTTKSNGKIMPLSYKDTQILPNKKYAYKIQELVLVYGNSLTYTVKMDQITYTVKSLPTKLKSGKAGQVGPVKMPSPPSQTPLYQNKSEKGVWDGTGYSAAGKPGMHPPPKKAFDFFISVKNEPLTTLFCLPVQAKPLVALGKIVEHKPEVVVATSPVPPTRPVLIVQTYEDINNKVIIGFEQLTGGYTKATTTTTKVTYEGQVLKGKKTIKEFTNKAPVQLYHLFRMTSAPLSYEEFPLIPHKIVDGTASILVDTIEPNTKYWYYAKGLTAEGVVGDESYIVTVEILDEHGMIYGMVENYNIPDENERIKKVRNNEKRFKKLLRITPAFLQGAPNPSGDNNYIGYIDKAKSAYGIHKMLFDDPNNTIGDPHDMNLASGLGIKPKFKFRLTSLKSRRKFDINVLYTKRTYINPTKIPDSAELVYYDLLAGVTDVKGGPGSKMGDLDVGAPCVFDKDCKSGMLCKGKQCQPVKVKEGAPPMAGPGAKKGDVGLNPFNNTCIYNEDCDPTSCIGLVTKCVKKKIGDKTGACKCVDK